MKAAIFCSVAFSRRMPLIPKSRSPSRARGRHSLARSGRFGSYGHWTPEMQTTSSILRLSLFFDEGTFPPTDRADMSLLLRCQRPFCELALIYSLPVGSNRFKVCGKIGDFLTAEAAERHESCKLLKLSQIRGTPA